MSAYLMKQNVQERDSWPFVGQETLGRHILEAEQAGRLSGPLLFSGPAATGKAAAARWLARRAGCQSSTTKPCGQCASCRQAEAGQHPNITELQAEPGERIGIDQVRDILQSMAVKTWGREQRWLLFLDAEQLTEQASNAVLKFLEEVPAGCRVILTSSQPDALLATVRSRLTEYRWHFASTEAMRQLTNDPQVTRRAAGRPGWADVTLSDYRQTETQRLMTVLEKQSFMSGSGRDRVSERSVVEQQLRTEELILRELLLARAGAEGRLLWPTHRDGVRQCAEVMGFPALLALAERYLDRYELSPNIQPRLLYEDLHLV